MNIAYYIPADECSSYPCQNGGTCTDEFDAYRCECVAGTYGTNCENGKIILM